MIVILYSVNFNVTVKLTIYYREHLKYVHVWMFIVLKEIFKHRNQRKTDALHRSQNYKFSFGFRFVPR